MGSVGEFGQGRRVQTIVRREIDILLRRGKDISKANTIRYLRAEFEPPEIEITADTEFDEIVRSFKQNRSLSIAIHIVFKSSAGNNIRPVVAFAHSGELEIKGYGDRDTEDIDILFELSGLASNGFAGLGDVSERALRERQSGTEAQIEVTAESYVGDESYGKTGHKVADACVVDITVNLNFGVGDAKGHEVHT